VVQSVAGGRGEQAQIACPQSYLVVGLAAPRQCGKALGEVLNVILRTLGPNANRRLLRSARGPRRKLMLGGCVRPKRTGIALQIL